jgi:hypothetical protein
MKNTYTILLLICITLGCKAQSPQINISDYDGKPIQGANYVDSDNLLNPFVGTYLYINGNDSLKIVLQKKTLSYDGYKYQDLLIGEYQYIENGVEKSNTLSNLNTNYVDQYEHGIHGNGILRAGDYLCTGCVGNEIRILGGLIEYSTDNWAQIKIARTTVGNQQAIILNMWWQMGYHIGGTPLPTRPSFPDGEYTLLKQ